MSGCDNFNSDFHTWFHKTYEILKGHIFKGDFQVFRKPENNTSNNNYICKLIEVLQSQKKTI